MKVESGEPKVTLNVKIASGELRVTLNVKVASGNPRVTLNVEQRTCVLHWKILYFNFHCLHDTMCDSQMSPWLDKLVATPLAVSEPVLPERCGREDPPSCALLPRKHRSREA